MGAGLSTGSGVLGAPAATCDVDGDGLLDFTDAPLDPGQVDSDSTSNFELGGKFTLLDNRLTINTAIFHIDWDDLPIGIADTSDICANVVSVNGGKARSRGIELETAASLTEDISITLGVGYVDAEFRSNDIGSVGDACHCPPSSMVISAVRIRLRFDGQQSFIRADFAYVGDYLLEPGGTTPPAGDYTKLNLRAAVAFSGSILRCTPII